MEARYVSESFLASLFLKRVLPILALVLFVTTFVPSFYTPDQAYFLGLLGLRPWSGRLAAFLLSVFITQLVLFLIPAIVVAKGYARASFWIWFFFAPVMVRLFFFEPDDFGRSLIYVLFGVLLSVVLNRWERKSGEEGKVIYEDKDKVLKAASTVFLVFIAHLLAPLFWPPILGAKTVFVEYQTNYLVPLVYLYPMWILAALSIVSLQKKAADSEMNPNLRAFSASLAVVMTVLYVAVFLLLAVPKATQILGPLYYTATLFFYYVVADKLETKNEALLLLLVTMWFVVLAMYWGTNAEYYSLATYSECEQAAVKTCDTITFSERNTAHFCFFKYDIRFKCGQGGGA